MPQRAVIEKFFKNQTRPLHERIYKDFSLPSNSNIVDIGIWIGNTDFVKTLAVANGNWNNVFSWVPENYLIKPDWVTSTVWNDACWTHKSKVFYEDVMPFPVWLSSLDPKEIDIYSMIFYFDGCAWCFFVAVGRFTVTLTCRWAEETIWSRR